MKKYRVPVRAMAEPNQFTYRTRFTLEAPVNDYDAAYEYLTEDDMTVYLKDSCGNQERLATIDPEDIISIRWELQDEQSGYIELKSYREFTPEELKGLGDWIRGQCSDGLGEGFEQQDFADYFEEDDYAYAEEEYERDRENAEAEYDEMSEEEQEAYGDIDSYIDDYAGNPPDEWEYHHMASFDWETNDYLLKLV